VPGSQMTCGGSAAKVFAQGMTTKSATMGIKRCTSLGVIMIGLVFETASSVAATSWLSFRSAVAAARAVAVDHSEALAAPAAWAARVLQVDAVPRAVAALQVDEAPREAAVRRAVSAHQGDAVPRVDEPARVDEGAPADEAVPVAEQAHLPPPPVGDV